MKKCLILLTSCFPYDNKETFLENEIFFHSGHFEKIIILAQELSAGSSAARSIPDNAEAYNIALKNKKIARYSDVLRGVLRIFKPSDACKTDSEIIGKSLSKRVFCEYFEQRAQRQFNESLRIIKSKNFDEFDEIVIYSYWFFSNCRTGIFIKEYLESQGHKVKIISRAHRYDLYENVNKLGYLPLRYAMAKEVEKIYVCSDNGCEYLKQRLPNFSDKIETSYLGTFDRGVADCGEQFHIVTCSRTTDVKRLDKLVDSLAASKEMVDKKIVWTHIGDGPMQEKIKLLCKEKLDFIDVEFLGNKDNSDVYKYYSTHPVSLFVNVSSSEGLPVSIMEAISFGIPVLATDVGGTGEIVEDGYNGLLLSENFDADEFREKLSIFYKADAEAIRDFRSNARKTWEEKFNAQKNYPEFCAEISGAEYVTE